MKKRIKALAGVMATMLLLTGCSNNSNPEMESGSAGSGGSEEKKLVVYTSESEIRLNQVIPYFEEETGIEVELITGGLGELTKRLETEAGDPNADIMMGSGVMNALNNAALFEEYVSPNNEYVTDAYKSNGVANSYIVGCSVLLVNTDLVGDIEVNGYKDLLNPELKGKIATADAASSSSAMEHVENILADFAPEGEPESEEGWQYIQNLLYNIDGCVLSSSSAVHKGVAEGEYAIGLTYESPSATYIHDGATNLKIVYMEEGVQSGSACVMLVKNAKHTENAKRFIDFCLSAEVQQRLASEAASRPVRNDVKLGDGMKPTSELKLIELDEEYITAHLDEWKERWTDCVANVQ